jgi:ATP-binding cassette subfamily B protein
MVVQYITYAFAYDKTYYVPMKLPPGENCTGGTSAPLILGFFGSRDPGDLTTMMLGITHWLSRRYLTTFTLISGIALPVLAFAACCL